MIQFNAKLSQMKKPTGKEEEDRKNPKVATVGKTFKMNRLGRTRNFEITVVKMGGFIAKTTDDSRQFLRIPIIAEFYWQK